MTGAIVKSNRWRISLFVMLGSVVILRSVHASPLRAIAKEGDPAPGNTGNFRNFGQLQGADPAISGRNIAFTAVTDGGAGVYTYINGELGVIADTATLFPDRNETFGFAVSYGSGPSISGENVAFLARSITVGDSLWAYINGSLVNIASRGMSIPDSKETFNSFGGLDGVSPSISGQNVAFIAADTNQFQGVYALINGELRVVANTATLVPDAPIKGIRFSGFGVRNGVSPSISGENVAFSANWGGNAGVYALINGELRMIADTRTQSPSGGTLGNFGLKAGGPSISGENVAFKTAGAIYTSINGILTLIVGDDTPAPGSTGTFGAIPASPRISGTNVVIGAGADGLGEAIFALLNGSMELVVAPGYPVPGGNNTFTRFFLFDGFDGEDVRPAISGKNVVFTAGPNGIYAYFPPEHGDVDDNDCLNLFDIAAFQRCIGATTPPCGMPDSCVSVFDFDGNDTVDLADHAAFVTEMTTGR